ncbi:MAG: hypothetical protein EHM47_11650 [Ignavibacteriales bacterium]|nr:MAG: hypothetical protein EHM47_11650 [Ignavibacteriales bacterium]
MIFRPKIFYETYQQDYHSIKAVYLKKMLDNPDEYKNNFIEKGSDSIDDKQSFRRVLLSDLRQNYFHCIETFFELFFALNPKGKKHFDDDIILYRITNSDFRKNNKKVEEIANNDRALDFLNERFKILEYDISIGQYIFYMGIFNRQKFPKEVFDMMDESIEALKYGIPFLAKDFLRKEEYNAYKHGLRTINSAKTFIISKSNKKDEGIRFDLSESMSYYSKTKNIDEIQIYTILFDPERDFKMTLFCSHLIHHMIEYRKISFNKNNPRIEKSQFPITFFDKEEIKKCCTVNVKIQDIIFTSKRNESSS